MSANSVFTDVEERRAGIIQRVDAARTASKRADPVTLVAVSKVQPEPRIEAALGVGHRVFGENRVQEAMARWARRRGDYPDLELRLVGPLQSNKAGQAAELFDVIETLDRAKLARALAAKGEAPPCLIQVNTGLEAQKAGVLPEGLEALLGEARALGLQIDGLMCIPPVAEPAGPHFAFLAKLAASYGLKTLSMGMSADFETAIAFGATHVRIGSAFFGARTPVA
ncbi:MAG: YggS family pyridoxal phosphate-dependent enzyme [Pseudomonadota bacterium]